MKNLKYIILVLALIVLAFACLKQYNENRVLKARIVFFESEKIKSEEYLNNCKRIAEEERSKYIECIMKDSTARYRDLR